MIRYQQRTARHICTRYGFSFLRAMREFRKGKRWCSIGKHFWFNRRGYACKNACGPCRRALTTSGEKMHRTTMHRFNKTPEWYANRLAQQENCCAICRQPERFKKNGKTQRLGVDHDHGCCPGRKSCGKCIRGLLCNRCNILLTHLERFVAEGIRAEHTSGWTRAAIEYLGKWQVPCD